MSLHLELIVRSNNLPHLEQRNQISMSSTWNKRSSKGIIPPTVQEQPEDEAQATAAGQDYQYPDVTEIEDDNTQIGTSVTEPIEGPREGYGRPRSAPSSDQSGWFPREGQGRPLSAGGAARHFQAAMKSNVLATDDHQSHDKRADPPHGDYFLHYPQVGSDGNPNNSFDYNKYSRCRERDLEVEDYFTDSSSSASEEDEILYDATVEDPDRVKHFTGCLDIGKEDDFLAELGNEEEKLQEDAMNNKTGETGRRGMNNNVYKPRQRLSADFSSIENQQMLYAKGTGTNVYPIKTNEEITLNHLHKLTRSIYTLENIKGDAVPTNVTTKQGSSKLNIEQTADPYVDVQNKIDSSEILMNDKQIENKSNTVPAVLSKPFLTRVKLGPPSEPSITAAQDGKNRRTNIVCETKYPIKALTLPNYKNKKKVDSGNSLVNISGSTLVKRQIAAVTIANKNQLDSNRIDEIVIPLSKFSKVKDNNIQCMAVSRSLTQSLEVGKMKLRLVAGHSRKQHDVVRR